MTCKHRFLFPSVQSHFASFFRENSDCHNATGPHQEHDIATVRGTEVLVRILGFAPQLYPQSLKHSKLPNAKLIIKPTIDKTSNSAGRKYKGMHMNWLTWTAWAVGGGRRF